MPDQRILRAFGHNLVDLTNAVHVACLKRGLALDYPRPTSAISAKIIERLDAFADAGRGRYANFGALGDPNLGREEPIRRWWDEVAELILRDHYHGKQVQATIESDAKMVDEMFSPHVFVYQTSETGDAIQDLLSGSIRTGQSAVVQRYGRYYMLTIARWLSNVFSILAEACYANKIDAFFAVWEYFHTYTVDDSFLKSRKIWPLG